MTLPDNDCSNHSRNETFQEVLQRRLNRRSVLKGALAVGPLMVLGAAACGDDDGDSTESRGMGPFSLGFQPVAGNSDDTVTVADGYEARTLIQWGDPLFEGTARLASSELANQTAADQEKRFGYNTDFLGYFPLNDWKSTNARSVLLAVNHEYTNEELMFPAYDPCHRGPTDGRGRAGGPRHDHHKDRARC